MSEQENIQVIQRLYEAFRHGDMQTVLGLLDPRADLVVEAPRAIPWSGTRHGRDGWTRFLQVLGETLDDITLSMEPFAAQGDKVVFTGRYQARVKSTGSRIDSPLVHMWTLRDGMIVKCQEATNTAAEMAACTFTANQGERRRANMNS